jgi:predicted amidohydrolase
MGPSLLRAGLVQITAGDDPLANLPVTETLIRDAAAQGAALVLTPEITNFVSFDRHLREARLHMQDDDPTLARLRAVASATGIWLLIGSLALKTGADRLANRSFLIRPDGGIAASYDKIHMFDVDLDGGESYRESAAFRPGDRAVVADTPFAPIGMTVCYDVRFAGLYRTLAQAGARILTVPAAFTVPTGRAHWETLLRARAIETGSFVLAPAQCGTHPSSTGALRQTWGHSLAISPWGDVIADGGDAPGVTLADLDLTAADAARARIPALRHDRTFTIDRTDG